MKYYWKITKDRITTEEDIKEYGDKSAVGKCGPYGCDVSLKANPSRFSMYDDDDECYYEGMIYGDYDGLEPLDDFGMPNAGCTYIKINGKVV